MERPHSTGYGETGVSTPLALALTKWTDLSQQGRRDLLCAGERLRFEGASSVILGCGFRGHLSHDRARD
jgi:hypothetical protein